MAKNKSEAYIKELVLTRIFDAPRSVVFKAWTNPKQMAQWWGPRGFTNPVCELDVKPNGAIRIDMCTPEGVVLPCMGTFHEIIEPARLVFTTTAFHDEKGNPRLEVLNTVTFEEISGKTKLTLTAQVLKATPELAGPLAGMDEGWSQSLDRLETLTTNTTDREILTTRMLDAPRDLVWQVWTDPKHIIHWWGPIGFTNTIHKMDVSPGGIWQFIMHGPDGTDYRNEISYIEVVKPERLVYDHISTPKFHVVVTFEEEGKQTKLTMRALFDTAALREHVVKTFNAVQGAVQTLGRLKEYLAHL